MKDQSKTKKLLIQELASLKQRIAEPEQAKPERKQAAENSRGENLFRQSIIDSAADGICVCHDVSEFPYTRFTVWNRHMTNITGYTMTEINRQGWYQGVSPDPAMQAKAVARMDRMRQGDNLDQEEWEITRKDGQRRQLLVSTCILPGGETGVNILAVMNDITDHKWTENALRESKEQYRALVENASDIVFRTDSSGHFTFVNPAGVRITGYGEKELIGKHYPTLIRPDVRDETIKFFGRQFVKGINNTYSEYPILTKDGHDVWLGQNTQLIVEDGHVTGFQAVSRDITERKQAEDKLRIKEMQLRTIIESTGDGILAVDNAGSVIKVNQRFADLWRIPPDILEGKNDEALLTCVLGQLVDPGAFLEKVQALYTSTAEDFDTISFQDGRVLERYSCPLMSEGIVKGRVWSFRDITERKQAEEMLRRSEEKFRFLTENMNDNIFTMNLNLQTTYVSQSIEKILGFTPEERMKQDVTEQVTPESMIIIEKILSKELEREEKGLDDPNRSIKFEVEYYHKDGSTVWMENVISGIRDDQGVAVGIHGVSRDITERKRSEHALKDSLDRLHKSLGATIQAMAVTVETRDPYTAGHQRRVADLARSIAKEMNLPSDQIEGLRMASTIHDLGKISVPAEILSKPKKLTDVECELIKTHARSGYDILKDIDFPWPVARIILEHHEKMDGSGYPNGSVGENILLESRILAVADVVEAMASHRPYRPSLGIDAAFKELEENKGTKYDAAVVEACLNLFRKKGYQFVKA
jgi:PAS domain S-box-containing protein